MLKRYEALALAKRDVTFVGPALATYRKVFARAATWRSTTAAADIAA
jgi:hypothetical protein